MSLKLHPRCTIVATARVELHGWLMAWMERHNLTWIEGIRELMMTASDWMRYPLRSERHPDDPDKKADEE